MGNAVVSVAAAAHVATTVVTVGAVVAVGYAVYENYKESQRQNQYRAQSSRSYNYYPEKQYYNQDKNKMKDVGECALCKKQIKKTELHKLDNCKHFLHSFCFDDLIKYQAERCPDCRAPLKKNQ